MKSLTLIALVVSIVATPARALEAGERVPQLPELAGLSGKVAYVDFWASWCAPCRQSMPALDVLYRTHGARGFTVLGVNKDVDGAEARRFLERVRVSFPLVPDEGDRVARAFSVKAMPSGYLLDRSGVVRYVHRGFTAESAAALQKQVEQLLAETK